MEVEQSLLSRICIPIDSRIDAFMDSETINGKEKGMNEIFVSKSRDILTYILISKKLFNSDSLK